MSMSLKPYAIGCEPTSVSDEMLLQDGWKTYLLFDARSTEIDATGYFKDLVFAVVDCRNCVMSKFGYPNDEGLPEHPLYDFGLEDAQTSILEVIDSAWASEISSQMLTSARRIWKGRGWSEEWSRDRKYRHFLVPLKEKTFECLAEELIVDCYFKAFDEAIAYAIKKLKEH